jgi:transposase
MSFLVVERPEGGMERLDLNSICDIVYRLRRGQSERGIAKDLGNSRHTVRHYHYLAREKGYLDLHRGVPEPEELLRELGPPSSAPVIVSTVEPYRSVVESLLKAEVEMATIHSRLVREHGYRGSYSSVKRFVRRLRPKDPDVCIRLETGPGREAQVDFGGVGKIRDRLSGKKRQAYCFVMTLSYSRHQYAELVFDQKMQTWIGCHRRAFEFFGGVPQEVVIDNLKAAVLKAELENPTLSVPYTRLARHYGFLVHPCRVRTPEHKGKVENGVHYVQRSVVAGREFVDIEEANRKLIEWVINEAGVRDHGTTHEAPMKRFTEREASALLELPAEPFELVRVAQGTVGRDTFIQLDGSYYQAPYKLVRRKLDVYVYERIVQIYDGVELLVTHERATHKGQRMTRDEFYPPDKSPYVTRPREQCGYLASLVGPRCRELVEGLLSERPLDKLRSVHGVLRLGEKHGNARLERACARAIYYGDPSYVRVKKILESGLDHEELDSYITQMSLPIYEHARSAEEFFGDIVPRPTGVEVSRC